MDRDDDIVDRRPVKKPNILFWVCVGGGILLLSVFVCSGIAYFGFQAAKSRFDNIPDADIAAETFWTKLQAENFAAAYQLTSRTLQARQSPQQFERFVTSHPAMTQHIARSPGMHRHSVVDGVSRYTLEYTLNAPGTGLNCTLVLVEENGAWVVASISVP